VVFDHTSLTPAPPRRLSVVSLLQIKIPIFFGYQSVLNLIKRIMGTKNAEKLKNNKKN